MNLTKLPDNLPRPMNDGSCDHLLEMTIPSTSLPSTKEKLFDICKIDTDFIILYIFSNDGHLRKKSLFGMG